MKQHNLIWFRTSDLRIRDNTALYHACKDRNIMVSAIFIATPKQWFIQNFSPKKIYFIYLHLVSLKKDLKNLGINLYYFESNFFISSVKNIINIFKNFQITHFFYNYQYEEIEKKQEKIITELLNKKKFLVLDFMTVFFLFHQF